MFLPHGDFPWTRELEAGFPDIEAEYLALDRRRLKRWPETELYNQGWGAFGLSLALLRRVKELDPSVVTMLGGANCEAEMGWAAIRAFPWVDFVVPDGESVRHG